MPRGDDAGAAVLMAAALDLNFTRSIWWYVVLHQINLVVSGTRWRQRSGFVLFDVGVKEFRRRMPTNMG
jgi:hypothetical protein